MRNTFIFASAIAASAVLGGAALALDEAETPAVEAAESPAEVQSVKPTDGKPLGEPDPEAIEIKSNMLETARADEAAADDKPEA